MSVIDISKYNSDTSDHLLNDIIHLNHTLNQPNIPITQKGYIAKKQLTLMNLI